MTGYRDLADLPEDERLKQIGEAAESGLVVGAAVEADDLEKHQRYIQKIQKRFPMAVFIQKIKGPVPGVVILQFGRRLQ